MSRNFLKNVLAETEMAGAERELGERLGGRAYHEPKGLRKLLMWIKIDLVH